MGLQKGISALVCLMGYPGYLEHLLERQTKGVREPVDVGMVVAASVELARQRHVQSLIPV